MLQAGIEVSYITRSFKWLQCRKDQCKNTAHTQRYFAIHWCSVNQPTCKYVRTRIGKPTFNISPAVQVFESGKASNICDDQIQTSSKENEAWKFYPTQYSPKELVTELSFPLTDFQ